MNIKQNLTLILSLLTSLVLFPMNSTAAEQPHPTSTIYMITLHTDKFEDMLDFYSNKMDMKIKNRNDEFVEFRSKGVRLSLTSRKSLNEFVPAPTLQNQRQGSGIGIGFKYETNKDVDNAYSILKSKGVKFVASPKLQSWGEYTAFFADPDGNIHELVSF